MGTVKRRDRGGMLFILLLLFSKVIAGKDSVACPPPCSASVLNKALAPFLSIWALFVLIVLLKNVVGWGQQA